MPRQFKTPNKKPARRKIWPGLLAICVAALAVSGNSLYQAEIDNRIELQDATDIMTLTLLSEDRFRIMTDPIDALRLRAHENLNELYPQYELVSVDIDDDRIVSLSMRVRKPLLANTIWPRLYEASAHAPIPKPICEDIHGLELELACIKAENIMRPYG